MAQQSFASVPPSSKTRHGARSPAPSAIPFEPELLKILHTSKTPQAVIDGLLGRVHPVLGIEGCILVVSGTNHPPHSILLWQPERGLQITPPFGLAQRILQKLREAPPPNLKAPLAIPHIQAWLDMAPSDWPRWGNRTASVSTEPTPFASLESCQSALISKAYYQGKSSGTLILLRAHPHPWTEMDMQVCHTLSTQIAIALSQGHLQHQIEQQLQQQSLIYRLVEVIREGWELEQIFDLALEGLVHLLQVSRGMVLSFKYADPPLKGRTTEGIPQTRATVDYIYPTTDALSTELQETAEPSTWLRYQFQISDCTLGRQILAAADNPVVIPPVGANPDTYPVLYPELPQAIAPLLDLHTMPSLLVMPLEHQGIGLGCLILQHQHLRGWHPDELALVRLVATHVSTAMIQARTLRKVQALVEERTAQLRHSLDVQAKLYEKTRQQVEQLQRMNQVMEEFLSTVSHELLTPLTSMKMAIRMLRDAPLNADQRERYLAILDRQCTQETHLIRDLLTLQNMEAQDTELQLHQVNLQGVIQDLHQSWEASLASQGLIFQTQLPDRPILLRTDPESLHRILNELLTNAQKYSTPDSAIQMQVVVEASKTVPLVTLALRNRGIGIMPDELSMVFEKFRRGRQAIQQAIPGIGLGLALVRGLAAHLSGAIAANSTPIPDSQIWETCFTLTLPLSPDLAR